MWRFFEGLSQPPAKKKKKIKVKLKQERLAMRKNVNVHVPCCLHVKKTDRGFFFYAGSYRVSVHIPQTTTSGGKMLTMFCEICKTASQTDKTFAQNNVFVQGCSSFRVESVKIHESSTNHARAAITILSLIMHDPNWNRASRPSGSLARLTTHKKMNMDPWVPAILTLRCNPAMD